MDYLTQRRQTLVKTLKKDGADAILVTHPVNVSYLTGFTGDSSYLVATAKQFVLVSDSRFDEQIKEECPGLEVHIRPHDQTTVAAAVEVLTKTGAKAVGLEADHATLGLMADLQEAGAKLSFAPVRGRVEALRALKDPSEVEQIRAAVKAAERAFVMFKSMLREADTEKDMSDAIESYVRRAGGRSCPFPPIVAVGERGALPHAPPTDRQLGDGSKLLVDWGADLGYKSDMTRTFRSPFGTAPTRRNKAERVGYVFDEIYELVRSAQEAAVATIRDGVPAAEVDAAARQVISDAGYADHFTHGTGHGIGLEIHEAPRIRANSPDVLAIGMVVTIEPGIYLPDWGGVRLEDDFLVTREGCVRLTNLPHDPGAIE
ncbi:MAG TPA: Xaa-Pro peptidase family protein [Fimbriiglobus sp.]|jgi:Xaa-Pro aminopeptidase|nr:Xaa-Pro peptidase family protein [Fimbriiglobus sp.]